MKTMKSSESVEAAEISRHRSRDSCWIVIDGKVYDTTRFLFDHPGGPAIILRYGGADATSAFREVHTDAVLEEHSSVVRYVGEVKDPQLLPQITQSASGSAQQSPDQLPPLLTRVILDDFYEAAKPLLEHRVHTFVASSAQNYKSLLRFRKQWQRVHFRPRIMRDVSSVDTSAAMLGHRSRLPIFICPTGMIGSVHPDAELVMARAAARSGIHYCVSTATTLRHHEIVKAFKDELAAASEDSIVPPGGSRLFYQLYLHADHEVTRRAIRRAKELGFSGLFLTVDTAGLGKRIEDRRLQAQELIDAGLVDGTAGAGRRNAGKVTDATGFGDAPADGKPQIGGRAAPGVMSASLNWQDLKWIKEEWGRDNPVVLKGVQTADDALLALQAGCAGIYLSNHGGRQLQYAPGSLDTLVEIRQKCPEILTRIECYVDGGFHSGADALKALCLGATAVGVGRPFLYAAAAYGSEGVQHAVDILSDEMEISMRLLGITSLDQAKPEMVRVPPLGIEGSRL